MTPKQFLNVFQQQKLRQIFKTPVLGEVSSVVNLELQIKRSGRFWIYNTNSSTNKKAIQNLSGEFVHISTSKSLANSKWT